MATLETMPAETQLRIFRQLLPKDLDQLRGKDLASARLICRSLRNAATEIFFERHIILLWKVRGVYIESPSVRLLSRNPELAALVKSVWVALASASPAWLERKAAFNFSGTPDPDVAKTKELAYKCTHMWLYRDDDNEPQGLDDYDELLNECRAKEDFTLAQYKAIEEYHDQFIKPGVYNDLYNDPVPEGVLEVLLIKRLRLLPNVQQVRFASPKISRTLFYQERLGF
jgi:hypothetical protein